MGVDWVHGGRRRESECEGRFWCRKEGKYLIPSSERGVCSECDVDDELITSAHASSAAAKQLAIETTKCR